MLSEKIESLHDAYAEERCFIVAGGTSLAYRDLSFLKDEYTITMNLSVLQFDMLGIEPDFHIVADRNSYLLFQDIFDQLIMKRPIYKFVIGQACYTYPDILTDEWTCFSPAVHMYITEDQLQFAENPMLEGFYAGDTVAYTALQLAYYLGFKEVNIIGMDMDVCRYRGRRYFHSYDLHRHPDYHHPLIRSLEDQTQDLAVNLMDYHSRIEFAMGLADSHFKKDGRRLVNDARSTLQTLEKRDLLKQYAPQPSVSGILICQPESYSLMGKPHYMHAYERLCESYLIDEITVVGSQSLTEFPDMILLDEDTLRSPQKLHQVFKKRNLLSDLNCYLSSAVPFIAPDTMDNLLFKLMMQNELPGISMISREYLLEPIKNVQHIERSSLMDCFYKSGKYLPFREFSVIRKSTGTEKDFGDFLCEELTFPDTIEIHSEHDAKFSQKYFKIFYPAPL